MNAVTPTRRTSKALNNPITIPRSSAADNVMGTIIHPGKSKFSPCEEPNHAVTMADSAIVASQERSICPAIMTIARDTDKEVR